MVEIHHDYIVLHLHDSPVQTVAVAVEHRKDVAGKHTLGVKFAVHYEEVLRQFEDVFGVDFTISFSHGDDKVECIALGELGYVGFKTLQCDAHARNKLERMLHRSFFHHDFFTVIVHIQLVGHGNVFVCVILHILIYMQLINRIG